MVGAEGRLGQNLARVGASGQVLGQPDALLPSQVGALHPHHAVFERGDDRARRKSPEEHGAGCAALPRRGVATGAGFLEQCRLGLVTPAARLLGAGGDQGSPGGQAGRGGCRESRPLHEPSPENLSRGAPTVPESSRRSAYASPTRAGHGGSAAAPAVTTIARGPTPRTRPAASPSARRSRTARTRARRR